jgi:proteasome lid subunit RPN8/RPN11
MTTIELPNEQWEKIRQHGARDYPNECCGILLGVQEEGRRVVREARPAPNLHTETADENRRRRYTITPADLLAAQDYADGKGLDIVGIYHSHPDHPARPSQYDLDHAVWSWWSYIIVSIEKGTPALLTSWALAEDRSKFEEETVEICQPKS